MILLGMKNKIVKIYFEAWDEILIVEIPSKKIKDIIIRKQKMKELKKLLKYLNN